MKFYIHTFGCQMNEYDSSRLSQALVEAGWEPADSETGADLLLANTCTVRQLAEEKAFSLIGRWAKWKKERPGLLIGMVGCLAQHLQERAFRRMPAIDFLAGPRAVSRIAQVVERAGREHHVAELAVHEFGPGPELGREANPVSAFVAAMEGCDQFCTYCAVPRARGREISRPLEEILEEARGRVRHGAREIVFLGQNITRYGHGSLDTNLARLLRQGAEIEPLLRLRFMTSHPGSFSEDLIGSMAENPKVCEALHLPVQSGSDAILTALRRGYTADHYLRLVEKIRRAVPDLSLTTDVIVGFPGETDADFQATLDLLAAAGVDAAYCFKFSPRSGTVAALLPDQVEQPVKESRLDILLKRIEEQALAAKLRYVGRQVQVLVEKPDSRTDRGWLQGRTRSNFTVKFPGDLSWIGQERTITVTGASHWFLFGEEPV